MAGMRASFTYSRLGVAWEKKGGVAACTPSRLVPCMASKILKVTENSLAVDCLTTFATVTYRVQSKNRKHPKGVFGVASSLSNAKTAQRYNSPQYCHRRPPPSPAKSANGIPYKERASRYSAERTPSSPTLCDPFTSTSAPSMGFRNKYSCSLATSANHRAAGATPLKAFPT